MIESMKVDEVRKLLLAESKPKMIRAYTDEFNRKVLEQYSFDALVGLEEKREDSIKNIDGGINNVVAKIANKKNIAFASNLDYIRALPLKEKARYLARVRYNLLICRKAKAHYTLINASEPEKKSILISLGASTQQSSEHNIFNAT